MKTNIRTIRKKRVYTEEFKRSIVKEFESGKTSVLQLEKLYGVHNVSIYHWIYKFSKFNEKGYRIIEMKESSEHKIRDLEKKIKELQCMVGMKQIKIDYLEKMIDLAQEEYKIEIKKNSGTPPSGTSGKKANS